MPRRLVERSARGQPEQEHAVGRTARRIACAAAAAAHLSPVRPRRAPRAAAPATSSGWVCSSQRSMSTVSAVRQGAHRVDERAARSDQVGGRVEQLPLQRRRASRATSGSMRQRASARRRSDPRPEHGASTSTRSKLAGANGGRVPSAATTSTSSSPSRAAFWRDESGPGGPGVGRDHPGAVGGQQGGLAARPGAQVEHHVARLGAHLGRHPLRRRVLVVAVVPLDRHGPLVHRLERLDRVVGPEVGGEPLDDPVGIAQAGASSGQSRGASATRRSTALTSPRDRVGATPTVALTAAWAGVSRNTSW